MDNRDILTVDRIEENIIVCFDDNDNEIHLTKNQTDGEISESDVLIKTNGIYVRDKDLTEKRRKEIISLQDSLWE